jgi:hypothetical protein
VKGGWLLRFDMQVDAIAQLRCPGGTNCDNGQDLPVYIKLYLTPVNHLPGIWVTASCQFSAKEKYRRNAC